MKYKNLYVPAFLCEKDVDQRLALGRCENPRYPCPEDLPSKDTMHACKQCIMYSKNEKILRDYYQSKEFLTLLL